MAALPLHPRLRHFLRTRIRNVVSTKNPFIDMPEEEIAERILSQLRISVNLRKVSDVPVGVFLSGGIDSSTNAALFSETKGWPVKTFSIGYDAAYKSNPSEL